MDAQAISGAVGVVGVAVAALGLLLTWYRHERPKAKPSPVPRDPRLRRRRIARSVLAGALGFVVLGVTLVGATAALRVRPAGAGAPPPPLSTPLPPPAPPSASTPARPTEVQYRASMSKICTEADENARRIEEADPQGSVLGASVTIEKEVMRDIQAVEPPSSLADMHTALVGTWQRRLSLLESLYGRAAHPDARFEADLDAADRLAQEINDLATRLGVPECSF